ncbi:protein pangolin, isoforms A/H/I/S-like [Mya arenaria]|uniref:protein pangolin, isoforms A/H/I/S-like n=1 Tax=Mya arenaria TaxID=6604 RepID=UPI0022E09251|nr:protein pangolin, isoforms A/H/I/S-like [Mya arenaria]
MTMPHVNSGGNDDIYDSDEVKVYRHEGDEENEKKSSENLSEDKLGLVTETEENKVGEYPGNSKDPRLVDDGKPGPEGREGPFGYLPSGYPQFPNGAAPTTMIKRGCTTTSPRVKEPQSNGELHNPPPQKKARIAKSLDKTMLIFFIDSGGVLLQ